MNTANRPPSPGGCGSDRPYRGSGASESIRALQRRPRPFHACAYAAAVGLRRDHDTGREAVWPIPDGLILETIISTSLL